MGKSLQYSSSPLTSLFLCSVCPTRAMWKQKLYAQNDSFFFRLVLLALPFPSSKLLIYFYPGAGDYQILTSVFDKRSQIKSCIRVITNICRYRAVVVGFGSSSGLGFAI